MEVGAVEAPRSCEISLHSNVEISIGISFFRRQVQDISLFRAGLCVRMFWACYVLSAPCVLEGGCFCLNVQHMVGGLHCLSHLIRLTNYTEQLGPDAFVNVNQNLFFSGVVRSIQIASGASLTKLHTLTIRKRHSIG